MEDFFYYNISNNQSLKNELTNVLLFLENVNNKLLFTKINIREKENELLRFMMNKFKKLCLFQFMVNPNENMQVIYNNSLITLFNEITNNLNYIDGTNNSDYLEILKNKSIYKFLEELDEKNDYTSTTRRLLDLNQSEINNLKEKAKATDKKFDNIYRNLFFLSISSILIYNVLTIKLSTL